jgi:hypothetical protein
MRSLIRRNFLFEENSLKKETYKTFSHASVSDDKFIQTNHHETERKENFQTEQFAAAAAAGAAAATDDLIEQVEHQVPKKEEINRDLEENDFDIESFASFVFTYTDYFVSVCCDWFSNKLD